MFSIFVSYYNGFIFPGLCQGPAHKSGRGLWYLIDAFEMLIHGFPDLSLGFVSRHWPATAFSDVCFCSEDCPRMFLGAPGCYTVIFRNYKKNHDFFYEKMMVGTCNSHEFTIIIFIYSRRTRRRVLRTPPLLFGGATQLNMMKINVPKINQGILRLCLGTILDPLGSS